MGPYEDAPNPAEVGGMIVNPGGTLLAKFGQLGESVAADQANQYGFSPDFCGVRFPGADQLAKLLNAKRKEFERDIKPLIIDQFRRDNPDKAHLIGENPDVGYDTDTGNAWLRSRETGETEDTGVKIEWYGNE